MLVEQLLSEAVRVNLINQEIDELITQRKESQKEDTRVKPLDKTQVTRLNVLKTIKQHEVWEVSGSRVPKYGPSLSTRLSMSRELTLVKTPQGKIRVSQHGDSGVNHDDRVLKQFANTERGYKAALDYYISITRD